MVTKVHKICFAVIKAPVGRGRGKQTRIDCTPVTSQRHDGPLTTTRWLRCHSVVASGHHLSGGHEPRAACLWLKSRPIPVMLERLRDEALSILWFQTATSPRLLFSIFNLTTVGLFNFNIYFESTYFFFPTVQFILLCSSHHNYSRMIIVITKVKNVCTFNYWLHLSLVVFSV